MKNKDFDDLVESIKQAGKIRRGEMKASRIVEFEPADIKEIRPLTECFQVTRFF